MKIKSTVNFKNKTTLLLSWTKNENTVQSEI